MTRPPWLVVMPVYNDWEVVAKLAAELDAVFGAHGLSGELLLIDDGSSLGHAAEEGFAGLRQFRGCSVLTLHRNLGHQRAIAVGLAYVHERCPDRAVVLMDGDGEDRPEDVPRLVARFEETGGDRIVFAARAKRSESWLFQAFYRLYQLLHWVLIGKGVRVGNFSVIPPEALARLLVVSELWNHYSAAVFHARIRHTLVPLPRGQRLGGRSKMRFSGLAVHGLSALSVYSPVIGVRVVLGSAAAGAAGLALLGGLALAQACGGVAVPAAWYYGALGLVAAAYHLGVTGFFFTLANLAQRHLAGFLPARDCRFFVAGVRQLVPPSP